MIANDVSVTAWPLAIEFAEHCASKGISFAVCVVCASVNGLESFTFLPEAYVCR